MTQPLFRSEHWYAFVKKLGGKPPIPVLIGIWPLNSYKQALRSEQRSTRHRHSGTIVEIVGSSGRRRARPRLSSVPAKCSLGRVPNWPAPT